MDRKRLRTLLFGKPLASVAAEEQRIGPAAGVPVLGLDALASASYGPEAALTILLPLGAASLGYTTPLLFLIVGLLLIVQTSYRQTIAAYPSGGGSYTVARENLGLYPGLLAGSALFIDYVLNVAVAIAAGVGALVSAFPVLHAHMLSMCLLILAVITLVNLRGVRDSGLAFMIPTYAFVVLLGGILLLGIVKTLVAGGHPTPVDPPTPLQPSTEVAGAWLLLRAFSSGCTAMTGVEAVSNAVPIFRESQVKNARRTLSAIVAILGLLVIGLAIVCRAYGIGATPPGQVGYESVLSQAIAAVVGRGALYYLTMGAIVAVLCLSANTSFADFPRLCRVLAQDGFLPGGFAHQGPRLVYANGIVMLALLAGILLVAFRGITDHLIPLFAVGAFLAFTMSQAGMVAHWRRLGAREHRGSLVLNAVGAAATGCTLLVIVVSKLEEGAWVTVLVLAGLVLLFRQVKLHLDAVERETATNEPVPFSDLVRPIVVVPIRRLDRVAVKALRFAVTISDEIVAIEVLADRKDEQDLTPIWASHVQQPARAAGIPVPRLVVLRSSYRELVEPLLREVHRLAHSNPGRQIAVLVPELVQHRWYHLFLHSHTATLLKALLLFRGGPQVAVINTPWYLTRALRFRPAPARGPRTARRSVTPDARNPRSSSR